MKKWIVCMVLLVMVAGCWESLALVAGGAAGGLTTARVIQQQKEANQANIDLMEQQEAEDEAELAAETDLVKRKEIQERLDNTRTVLADLRVQKVVLDGLEMGSKTKWDDPQSVIPTIAAIFMMVLAERERRKKKKATEEKKLAEEQEERTYNAFSEVVDGGQEFKRIAKDENSADSVATFKKAMDDKQSPETKKMVAVIKA